MGVEYYILKPRTKEMFYLGKDLWYCLEGIPLHTANYASYEDWEDVLKDIISARCYSEDDNMRYMVTLSSEIMEFVDGEEVRIANDCEDDISWLTEYNETKSIIDICSNVYGDC